MFLGGILSQMEVYHIRIHSIVLLKIDLAIRSWISNLGGRVENELFCVTVLLIQQVDSNLKVYNFNQNFVRSSDFRILSRITKSQQ